MSESKCKIRFCVWGQGLDPDHITSLFDLKPEVAHKQGELLPNGKSKYKYGSWEVIKIINTDDFENEFELFLNMLDLRIEQVKIINKKFSSYIGITVYGSEMGELYIYPHLYSNLVSLGIGLNISFMSWSI